MSGEPPANRAVAFVDGQNLHGGDSVEWITPRVLAAPWWRVV